MSRFAEDVYAVVLAGGSGTRFWPKSRKLMPKQLCSIADPNEAMIVTTLQRLRDEIPAERRTIVTHRDQMKATEAITEGFVGTYLAEPEAKNTLAALVWAALSIRHQHGHDDAIMMSLHADHVILDKPAFLSSLEKAVAIARKDLLCLVGIKPTRAETGFGYIEQGKELSGLEGSSVQSFREKPDAETAQRFLDEGRFLWNSGLFVWKVKTFLEAVAAYAPQTLAALSSLFEDKGKDLDTVYGGLPSISVDEAILEKADNIGVVAGDFGWQDIGSWDALDGVIPADADGNRVVGEGILLDCHDVTVDTDGPLVCGIGLKDLVVVHHRGAILVCPKERSQDVKKIVALLKEQKRDDLI